MGVDITTHVEVRHGDVWTWAYGDTYNHKTGETTDGPFSWRSYGMFGFLADVRNYSHVPVISEPRGLPEDASPEVRAEHDESLPNVSAASWLTVAELLAYDYDQVFWDRRVTKRMPGGGWNGAALAEEGEGEHPSLREFLGNAFFADLVLLQSLGDPEDVRVVFWFD